MGNKYISSFFISCPPFLYYFILFLAFLVLFKFIVCVHVCISVHAHVCVLQMLHLLMSGNKGQIRNEWRVMCNNPSKIVHMDKVIQERKYGVAACCVQSCTPLWLATFSLYFLVV